MSHFTVLVIGDSPEEQLAPFQENNMGDCPKKYTKFNDQEDEMVKEFETKKRDMIETPDGKFVCPYDKQFEQPKKNPKDFTERAEYKFPKGFTEKEVPFKTLYKTIEEFVKDYHGCERDPKKKRFGYWENPNRRWDWYQLGGRWTGFFKMKNNGSKGDLFNDAAAQMLATKFRTSRENVAQLAEAIKSGDEDARFKLGREKPVMGGFFLEKAIRMLLTKQYTSAKCGVQGLGTPPADDGRVDQAFKFDIDFQGMRDEAADAAGERYDRLTKLLGGTIPKLEWSWESIVDDKTEPNWDKKREKYHGQPALKAVKEASERKNLNDKDRNLLTWIKLEEYRDGREAFVGRAIRDAFSTHAVLKDGKWYERGEMGWWACVHDPKDGSDWSKETLKLIESVSDDTMLSVYDCHI